MDNSKEQPMEKVKDYSEEKEFMQKYGVVENDPALIAYCVLLNQFKIHLIESGKHVNINTYDVLKDKCLELLNRNNHEPN